MWTPDLQGYEVDYVRSFRCVTVQESPSGVYWYCHMHWDLS